MHTYSCIGECDYFLLLFSAFISLRRTVWHFNETYLSPNGIRFERTLLYYTCSKKSNDYHKKCVKLNLLYVCKLDFCGKTIFHLIRSSLQENSTFGAAKVLNIVCLSF